jgi:hypothetical protein
MWYTRSYNYIHLTDVIGQLTVMHPLVKSSNLNGTSIWREVELHDLGIYLMINWFRLICIHSLETNLYLIL